MSKSSLNLGVAGKPDQMLQVLSETVVDRYVAISDCFCVFSWFTLEQRVDLKAEGVWDELLDGFQPDIVIKDWWVST